MPVFNVYVQCAFTYFLEVLWNTLLYSFSKIVLVQVEIKSLITSCYLFGNNMACSCWVIEDVRSATFLLLTTDRKLHLARSRLLKKRISVDALHWWEGDNTKTKIVFQCFLLGVSLDSPAGIRLSHFWRHSHKTDVSARPRRCLIIFNAAASWQIALNLICLKTFLVAVAPISVCRVVAFHYHNRLWSDSHSTTEGIYLVLTSLPPSEVCS